METKRRIKLTLAYRGEGFEGWQIQKRGRTVQGVLESAIGEMEGGTVRVAAAGRTDSGVHARAQVAHFDSAIASIPAEKYALALNRKLPWDLKVVNSEEVDPEFHARFSACARSYRYFLYPGMDLPLELQAVALSLRRPPSVEALNRAVAPLLGSRDFTVFAAAGDPSPSKVRSLYQAAFVKRKGMIEFRITGNAFLWRMVRSIVGTALECAASEDPASAMAAILSSGQRSAAGTTAPSRGLFFWKVHYTMESIYYA